MFHLLSISLTFLCCISLIWSNSPQNCIEKVYVVSSGPSEWLAANILCRQAGMELATIESREENEFLERELNNSSYLKKGVNRYWTSGVRKTSKSNEFVWFSNGKPFVYNNFLGKQPDNDHGNEACVQIFVKSKNEFIWNDFPCNQWTGYICQSYVRNLTCESISKSTDDC